MGQMELKKSWKARGREEQRVPDERKRVTYKGIPEAGGGGMMNGVMSNINLLT